MRLSETRYVIESNLPLLDNVKCENTSSSNYRSMSKVYMAVPAIKQLRTIPSLRKTIGLLERNKVFSMTMETFTIEASEADRFMENLETLKTQCHLIVNLADDIVPRMDANTICIKLPSNASFSTVADIAKAFDDLFNLVNANNKIDGTIKLQGVESGSAWIYALASTAVAALFIEKIVSCIYRLVNEHIETKKSIERLKQLECITEIKKDEKAIVHTLATKYINKLNNEMRFEEDPGVQGQWIKNIVTMVNLVERGMEITPSLEAPKDKQESTAKELSEITSAIEEIKKLEAATSDNQSEEPSTDDVSNNSSQDSNTPEE